MLTRFGVHFLWRALERGDAEEDEPGQNGDFEQYPQRGPDCVTRPSADANARDEKKTYHGQGYEGRGCPTVSHPSRSPCGSICRPQCPLRQMSEPL